jgi:hypothetical protein
VRAHVAAAAEGLGTFAHAAKTVAGAHARGVESAPVVTDSQQDGLFVRTKFQIGFR